MEQDRARWFRKIFAATVLLAALVGGTWVALDLVRKSGHGSDGEDIARGDILELDKKTAYSHIKITKRGNERTLWFVRDNGDELVESSLDLKNPHNLLVEYTRFMFLSYIFHPKQDRVLIVGLGGGSMVHFLKFYDKNLKVDVVEIDPGIVEIADKYFDVKTAGNVKIITQDAFVYLEKTDAKYDAIYMDAFLKPSEKTDPTGAPLNLKTLKFYADIQKKLTPDGMVVFNINSHDTVERDIKTIQEAFPQTYVFSLREDSGYVVVGSMAKQRLDAMTIVDRGAKLDDRFKTSYSFRLMAQKLRK